MGLRVFHFPAPNMLVWIAFSEVRADDILRECRRTAGFPNLEACRREIILATKGAFFNLDIHRRIVELTEACGQSVHQPSSHPVRSAFLCSEEQWTGAPQLWSMVCSENDAIAREYRHFTSPEPVSHWFGACESTVRDAIDEVTACIRREFAGSLLAIPGVSEGRVQGP